MTITFELAKKQTKYTTSDISHQHDDCILIALEWLGAQKLTKGISKSTRPLKHMIEAWAGRYVSTNDVEVAATILGLRGSYPHFNISARLVEPSVDRLANIGEAFKHPNYCENHHRSYAGWYATKEL